MDTNYELYYCTLAAYPLDMPSYIHVGGSGLNTMEARFRLYTACIRLDSHCIGSIPSPASLRAPRLYVRFQ